MGFKTKFKPKLKFDSPEELFRDLRNRSVEGLLSHQADILREYQQLAFSESDVALELPTGSGKTLVGLLIGEYRRRVNGERVVYLCPTRQLVNQVVNQSGTKYGIKTNAFTGSRAKYSPIAKSEYTNAEAIAVTTYSSLFNTNPFFYNPDLIILDDAHASENYIASFWSLSLNRRQYPVLYHELVEVIKDTIPTAQYQRMVCEEPNITDRQWIEKVPTPRFYDSIPGLTALLNERTRENDLGYTWSLICDHLKACQLYISWDNIIIRPVIPPSKEHKPFLTAKQKVYMSATLGAGGDLERITGAQKIFRLSIPKGWDKQGIGRRFFLFPEASLQEEEAINLAVEMTKRTPRTLLLVPDDVSAHEIQDLIQQNTNNKVYEADDLEESLEEFSKTQKAVAVLANRFDGIDLYGDDCRLLIIKGLPRATNLQEKFLESRMAASVILKDRIRTRIVQAIGRCTRSATDYAAVCILGQELTDSLIQKQNIQLFHPELQGELTFGYEESKKATVADFLENLNIFLDHGEEWAQGDNEIVARRDSSQKEDDSAAEKLLTSAKNEVLFQYAMWREDYEEAVEHAKKVVGILSDDDVKGYRGFWYYLAGSAAWLAFKNGDQSYEKVARDLFNRAAACTNSVTWLRNLVVIDSTNMEVADKEDLSVNLVEGLESYLGVFFQKTHQEILNTVNEKDIILIPITQVKWENHEWKHYVDRVKSGHIMQFLYLKHNPSLFESKYNLNSPFKIETKINYERAKCFLFIDDFAGTGKTIEDFLKAFESFYSLKPDVIKILVCYNIMTPASELLGQYFTKIYSEPSLDIFGKFSQTTKENFNEIKEILKQYELGFHSGDTNEHFKYLFGYGQVAASVYFEHNVPNNNLSILWYDSFNSKIGRRWAPLIFRHRNKDLKQTMYKSFIGLYKVKAEIGYQNRRKRNV